MSSSNEESEPALIPATTAQGGEYSYITVDGTISWSYAYDIYKANTRSECRIGKLAVRGFNLPVARPGDCIKPPWGLMQWMKESIYEYGFLLEHTQGHEIDPKQGEQVSVPEGALKRGGTWKAMVGPWRYRVHASNMGTKSERRIGSLRYAGSEVSGHRKGDYVDTPWGRLRWMGPIQAESNPLDYEQGFLLRGTYDRSLNDLAGEPVIPTEQEAVLRLESLYLDAGLRWGDDSQAVHAVSLMLKDVPGQEAFSGTLFLDPNECSLNEFGDRTGCTRIALPSFDVRISRMRLGDPLGLGRRIYEVKGEGIPEGMALITLREFEWCYLKLGRQLVPLYFNI